MSSVLAGPSTRSTLHLLVALAVLGQLGCLFGCDGAVLPPAPPVPTEVPGPVEVVALAGADLAVMQGDLVVLDAHASRALVGEVDLSWSQREGSAVLLTNPSAPNPSFIAPLAPARLVFQLAAEVNGIVDVDEVTVEVTDQAPAVRAAGFLELAGDDSAQPGEDVSFDIRLLGAGSATLSPTMRCHDDDSGAIRVEDLHLLATLPASLPCVIVIDAEDDGGRSLARAARVFWPSGTAIPPAPIVHVPAVAATGDTIDITLHGATGTSSVASADGQLPPTPLFGTEARVTLPRHPGHAIVAIESRLANASSGVQHLPFAFSSLVGSALPTPIPSPELVVAPGERFRITRPVGPAVATTATWGLRQVIGPAAAMVPGDGTVFIAPATSGVLLFHASLDDGRSATRPQSVRVVVREQRINAPPTLPRVADLFVEPGADFVLDGSLVSDETGYIERITFSQDENDEETLLPNAVTVEALRLTAGAHGSRYHLRMVVRDEGGMETVGVVVITVENAGPFVDPVTGNDVSGNGTQNAPFASIAAAIEVAKRHRFPTLRLATGVHRPLEGFVPPGLGLEGGWSRTEGAWRATGGQTVVPVGDDGVELSQGTFRDLTLQLSSAPIEVLGPAVLDAVEISSQARALEIRGSVELVDSLVYGEVLCREGSIALRRTEVTSAAASPALRASNCQVTLGAGSAARGAVSPVAEISGGTLIVERTAIVSLIAPKEPGEATTLQLSDAYARIEGAIDCSAESSSGARAIAGVASVIDVAGGSLTVVAGDRATTLVVDGGRLTVAAGHVASRTLGRSEAIVGRGAPLLILNSTILASGGAAAAITSAGDLWAEDLRVTAEGSGSAEGLLAKNANLLVGSLHVLGGTAARGVGATECLLRGVRVIVEGPLAEAVSTTAGATLVQTQLRAIGAQAIGVRAGTLTARSTLLVASGEDSAAGIVTSADLVQTTAVATAVGLDVGSAELILKNTALAAAVPLRSQAAPWRRATHVAFLTAEPFLLAGTLIRRAEDLVGCLGCIVTDPLAIDATGHLAAGDNPLVDAGDDDLDVDLDIDGDPIPWGDRPDIGCDERVPDA